MPTFTDFRDKKVEEFLEQGHSLEAARDEALILWNELSDKEVEYFKKNGFPEVTDDHKIIQKMKMREQEIQNNKDSKDFYPTNKGIKSMNDYCPFFNKRDLSAFKDRHVLIIPLDQPIAKKINKIIYTFEFLKTISGNNIDDDLLNDLKTIKEAFEKKR